MIGTRNRVLLRVQPACSCTDTSRPLGLWCGLRVFTTQNAGLSIFAGCSKSEPECQKTPTQLITSCETSLQCLTSKGV